MTSSDPDPGGRSARERAEWVVSLARDLRAHGIGVSTSQAVACARALQTTHREAPGDRYWAGRICLVTHADDLLVYDRVFARRQRHGDDDAPEAEPAVSAEIPAASDRHTQGRREQPLAAGGRASHVERLRRRRFADATEEELDEIGRALDRLRYRIAHRVTRRRRPSRAGTFDLARTLDRALDTDGEVLEHAWQAPRTRRRGLVVLLDVSGSMAAHARGLLRFAVAARRSARGDVRHRVEVFAFGTRLTRLSDVLDRRDVDTAIAAAAEQVVDWDGGTRLGDSVDELVRVWGRRGVLRGAVVVVCSDGLERGDPAKLATAMRRLQAATHRVVWVNPLAGEQRYEPVQRGMAAAMPYVDDLVAGHDLASVETLVAILGRSDAAVSSAATPARRAAPR